MESFQAVNEKTRSDLEILKKHGILKGFYLGGGTGLAFLLQHRESHDLDFFSKAAFNERNLGEYLRKAGPFSLEKKEVGTVCGRFHDTSVSFFHYPYPLLKKPKRISGVAIASVHDIACMKLDAVGSRGTKRDFIDLYSIVRQTSHSVQYLLKAFLKKYAGLHINLMHIKKSLVYFTDAEHDPMPRMSQPLSWEKVKLFFKDEVKKL